MDETAKITVIHEEAKILTLKEIGAKHGG